MKVAERESRLDEIGATAVFIAHDDAAALQKTMLKELEPPYPILVDVERTTYARWGLRRASTASVWLDPKVWTQYARLLLRGEHLGPPGRDTLQLGGDFVVDRAGTISYSRPQKRDDRPPVGELVRALEHVS